MNEALEDARAKVNRAGEHIQELKVEIRRFSESRPYSVTGDPDVNSGEYVLRIKPKETPKRIGVLIGDVLGNLRPSLDYLVAALVVLNGGKIKKAHQFPICDKPALFKRELAKGRLGGLPPDHVALIEKLQPYTRRKRNIWLRSLREYSNPDKHRHLNVVLTHIEGDFALPSPDPAQPRVTATGNVDVAMDALRKALERQAITRYPTTSLPRLSKDAAEKWARISKAIAPTVPGPTPGTVLPSVAPISSGRHSALAAAAAGVSPKPQAAKPPAKRNVHVELSVSVGVAFPDGAPVIETMQILESQVSQTLDAFEPLFD